MEKDPENLEYLRSQNVPDLVDGAIQQLVKEKPKDAGPWLAEYFDYPPHGIARGVKKLNSGFNTKFRKTASTKHKV